jgi:hypothetical protein
VGVRRDQNGTSVRLNPRDSPEERTQVGGGINARRWMKGARGARRRRVIEHAWNAQTRHDGGRESAWHRRRTPQLRESPTGGDAARPAAARLESRGVAWRTTVVDSHTIDGP